MYYYHCLFPDYSVAVVVGSTEQFSQSLREAKGRCTKTPQVVILEGYSTTWCDVNMVGSTKQFLLQI